MTDFAMPAMLPSRVHAIEASLRNASSLLKFCINPAGIAQYLGTQYAQPASNRICF